MHRKRNIWGAVMIVVIAALDRLTKILASKYLAGAGSAVFIRGIVNFTYAENTGAAFSILSGTRWLLCIITAAALAAIFWYVFSKKCTSLPVFWSVALVGAGGLGNFIDRVFYGYVIDFIEPVFIRFATFNLADCAVTLGVCALVVTLLSQICKKDKENG